LKKGHRIEDAGDDAGRPDSTEITATIANISVEVRGDLALFAWKMPAADTSLDAGG
jgi:hypothetical protein